MKPVMLLACALLAADAQPRPTVVVVVGVEGTVEYGRQFRQWAGRWEQAAEQAQAEFFQIGLDAPGAATDREVLEQRLSETATPGTEALWLGLIGHGTLGGPTG